MTFATLNGQSRLTLDEGGSILPYADERRRHVTLRLERAGVTVWTSDPFELGPDPSLRFSTSRSADYAAVLWPAAHAVGLLGRSAAHVVDMASGKERASFSAEFAGRASLEQVGLDVTPDGLLIITSTKRLWVINQSFQPVLRYEPRFILAGLPQLVDGKIVVDEYDFEAQQQVVTQVVDL